MAKKKKKDEQSDVSEEPEFEDALNELEAIVRRLEQGGGSLETALEEYSTAIGLMKICHQKLAGAERRVQLLSGVDKEGNPISEDLESESEEPLEQKQKARSRKRSAKPNADHEGGLF